MGSLRFFTLPSCVFCKRENIALEITGPVGDQSLDQRLGMKAQARLPSSRACYPMHRLSGCIQSHTRNRPFRSRMTLANTSLLIFNSLKSQAASQKQAPYSMLGHSYGLHSRYFLEIQLPKFRTRKALPFFFFFFILNFPCMSL